MVKVGELVDFLSGYDPEEEVLVSAPNHPNWLDITDVIDDGDAIVLEVEEID